MGQVDISPLAVTVQTIGTLMLAVMLSQLGRVSARQYARRWALAWLLLFVALSAIRVYIMTGSTLTWIVYLVLEWGYLAMVWSGCRMLVEKPGFDARRFTYALPAALVLAVLLTAIAPSFNELFIAQAGLVAVGAAASFRVLSEAPPHRRRHGWSVLRGSLAVMALLFASYVPLYAYNAYARPLPLLEFSSLADLMVSIALGFGMILVTAEEGHAALRDALDELSAARSGLQQKLQIDPLTDALSRHAFHSMQKGDAVSAETLAGVILMLDIDNLKKINDGEGHVAGDAVIRAAANAVRARIRADDLIFRWGGDEFVVFLPNSTLAMARERMAPLAEGVVVRISPECELRFRISWGAAEFGSGQSLEQAMKVADDQMYQSRSDVRGAELRGSPC